MAQAVPALVRGKSQLTRSVLIACRPHLSFAEERTPSDDRIGPEMILRGASETTWFKSAQILTSVLASAAV